MKTSISDRYEVDLDDKASIIGKGGQAVVYRGFDRMLQLEVAVKIYKLVTYTENIEALQSEYAQMERFSHPNVIHYCDWAVFTHQKKILFALVMNYADLGTLDAYRANLKAANLHKIRDVFVGILTGLKHIHNLGIVHRDLKPSNILLSSGGGNSITPIITDFLFESNLTPQEDRIATAHFDGFFGTIEYMSPELLGTKNAFVGPASDLWSFGVLIYEFFEGKLPFGSRAENNSPFRVAESILTHDPDFSGLPQPYNFLAEACLQKDLSDRIGDAQILIELINKYELKGVLEKPKSIKNEVVAPKPTIVDAKTEDATIVGFVNVRKDKSKVYLPPTIRMDATMPVFGSVISKDIQFGSQTGTLVIGRTYTKTMMIETGGNPDEHRVNAALLDEIQKLKEKIEALENAQLQKEVQGSFSKNRFQEWIAQNEIAMCLAELNKLKDNFSHKLIKTYIMIRAEWSELKMQEMHGIIEDQTLKTNSNKIRYKLLNFIDLVELVTS